MDEDNNLPELRTGTHHEALPPDAGLKFGANLWIHQSVRLQEPIDESP
jgi:hypothetical protein